jgi:hypothetical protein
MNRMLPRGLWTLFLLVVGTLLVLFFTNCSSPPPATTAAAPTTAPAAVGFFVAPHRGSAELWAETCSRCHNVRSPSAYSSDQWKVIVHDMRIRGELTGQEQRQILEFLQSVH